MEVASDTRGDLRDERPTRNMIDVLRIPGFQNHPDYSGLRLGAVPVAIAVRELSILTAAQSNSPVGVT